VKPLLADPDVRLSVSVTALESGVSATYGDQRFDTASIVKVDVLVALLLAAQDEGRELATQERSLAEAMIRRSDNAAANTLWWEIGGESGLDAANDRLGLTTTTGGADGLWGLTQTTSADQVALLRAVYGEDSALAPASQRYVQKLMGSVVTGQRWGISAASDGEFELKNGWLPRSQTGLWDVNSIGRVVAGGQAYLVAVVSDGHTTQADGIAAVEAAARAAVAAVDGSYGSEDFQDAEGGETGAVRTAPHP
jgi:beta-lactamase class A